MTQLLLSVLILVFVFQQQSIPGENLTRHKKILRAPAFEDDYLEDREDLSELNGQGLKRWDVSKLSFDQIFITFSMTFTLNFQFAFYQWMVIVCFVHFKIICII